MKPNNSTSKVWFITGASSGLGLEFTKTALNLGDKVVGVSRNIEPLMELEKRYKTTFKSFKLDITERASVFETVEKAITHFGKLDLVVNNAGNMILGMIEEFTEDDIKQQIDTNFYGAVWVSQAVLPHLRKQKSGHIIQISSIGGILAGPMTGIYSASKFALEGFSEALAQEVSHFGVHVSIVEPGGYWTNLYTNMQFTTIHEEYSPVREFLETQSYESKDSHPKEAATALLKLINDEKPPLRLILGSHVFDAAIEHELSKIKTWKDWETVSRSAEKAIPQPEE
ncbi:SDR family NAD(P)-dependent oxidoreductase [Shouchella lehensis]|uniref:SDR family NAD(P)-dependent oxidoreductase n=1 Tax=Shouchella lehensis TaxID=300825 RepID=A0A4Y7WKT5_9BACI|nr:SDR family NAD(P)-dependent oxidoreductase [Shouchella lehensis]MBG9783348.1 short-chain dehydrogenase [Shouchella lehensis]RQW22452.1 SDR family NAD(P)-dependent oxidoreductase [Bacillus sp. C1-1]TES49269.1 SDR family NAD(P)-dependent oxidoreductase [Shouchella lehensis]